MLSKHRERKNYLLSLSVMPIVVCVLAFARSAIYRITYTPSHCKSFGWYSSSSAEFQCDYKPLDIHATLALLWLAVFAIQVSLIGALGKPLWHRFFGRIGLVIAFANAIGMIYLAYKDVTDPMKKTDRPKDFTPFMFLVAFKVSACLAISVRCLYSKGRDIEGHMLWMFRTFVCSFTTPVIRFYPMVLRMLAGKNCFEANRDRFVMGAMFVSEMTCIVLYSLAQKQTRTTFWDGFMKLQFLTFLLATANEARFAWTHGLFIGGMAQCFLEHATDGVTWFRSS